MPQILKSAKDGQIAVKEFYTAGDIAFLMGVAHATAIRLIDQREIRGFWLPTKRRQRRITHKNLIAYVRRNPTCGTCSTSSTVTIRTSISPWTPSHHRPHARSALPLPGGQNIRGRQSAVRSPRRSTTQRRKSPSSWACATDCHREVGRKGHSGPQGPRHEIRSHDHLEMANNAWGLRRLRTA